MAKDATPAEQAEICAVYLRAMADPVRIQIIKALQTGPLTVTDLAELLELEMQNVSHHLRVLYHAHLVAIRKEGKFSYYHLNEEFLHHRGVAKSLDFGCCKIDIRE